MKNKQVTTDKLMQIRNILPHGSIKTIAKIVGITPERVSYILSGKMFDYKVIEEAVKIAEIEKEKIQCLNAQLDKVLKSGKS